MNREIIFRGLTAKGEWVYGDLRHDGKGSTVYWNEYSQRICWEYSNVPVKNGTVGQFTGLTDKNGIKIFEGDIVRMCAGEYCYGVWEYDSTFEVSDIRGVGLDFTNHEEIYVVGNVHEVKP